MARSAAIREHEKSGAEAPLHNDEHEADVVINNNTDEDDSSGDDSEYGEVERKVTETVARKLGWTSEEEWTRDKTKWKPASEFLAETQEKQKDHQERYARLERANEAALIEAKHRARQAAEAEVRQASISGDAELAVQAAHRLAQSSSVDPRVQSWIDARPWLNTDAQAHAVASAAGIEAAKLGYTTEEQMDYCDTAMKKRFPEYYPSAKKEEPKETRQAPAVQEGTRGSTTRSKEKGWADIPAGDRNYMAKTVKQMAKFYPNQVADEKAAQERLAKQYWKDKA